MIFLSRAVLALPLLGSLALADVALDNVIPPGCGTDTDACNGLTPDQKNETQNEFWCDNCPCNNKLLGQNQITTSGNWTTMFNGWVPWGGDCPRDFLCTWANWAKDPWRGYAYPPNDGGKGCPQSKTLNKGQRLDRFGKKDGQYLADTDASYAQRSIPPNNLNKRDGPGNTVNNYWVFEVIDSFDALESPIVPWFGQPGGANQWFVEQGVQNLIDNGFLQEVTPSDTSVQNADLATWDSLKPVQEDPMFYH
ncbi:hypothetical protein ASPFODRAFT_201825 [Aspergillus luchuensis CBS 106.47]|uniref:TNT domain-containing protein n=1 Tax=Aspergillus luchuensis (strain CBS 106.47) TaxID=1137211 RepID=A0A1M3TYW9_ASPLC|nr:hypothetical protein ASPFODRAFT_201825 [Aspergillus luchuensis CBS 106.47]